MNRFRFMTFVRRDPFRSSVRYHNLRAFRFLETFR